MAAVRHLELSSFEFSFCYLTSVAMPFCFPVQNVTEIGKSDAKLWSENDF